VALSQAVNEWQQAEWLAPEPRLRGSIVVPYEEGDLATAEIERWAGDPRFVQVILIARTREPLGRRKYWPMYEAAAHHNLPIGIHFGGNAGWPITGAGWPSFYIEDHVGMPQSFQPQIISMIYEGIFDRFPGLKIVLIEGGFAWLPSLMWRLDRSWQLLREEIPHLQRRPSDYVRENFWLTTQPIEEPPQPAYFLQLLEQLDMNDRFLFATDYPHWDFDAPDRALPHMLPPELKRQILADNARAFYRL
jgi:predicted TIM-barrel fold metal-dependent hydrolase